MKYYSYSITLFLFFIFSPLLCLTILKNKNVQNTAITIAGNLEVTENSCFNGLTTINGFTTIIPTFFQTTVNFNGTVYFNSNTISIGNKKNNTVLVINSLPTGTADNFLFIDSINKTLWAGPLDITTTVGTNYTVNNLGVDILHTSLIKSQNMTNSINTIIIGNTNNPITLTGQNLSLNTLEGLNTNLPELIINNNLITTGIFLENETNFIDTINITGNISANNSIFLEPNNACTINIENQFTTEYTPNNIIEFNSHSLQFGNSNNLQIPITIGQNNTLISFNNILNTELNDLFCVLDSNNILCVTNQIPVINTLTTNTLTSNSIMNINTINTIGNTTNDITYNATTMTFPQNINGSSHQLKKLTINEIDMLEKEIYLEYKIIKNMIQKYKTILHEYQTQKKILNKYKK